MRKSRRLDATIAASTRERAAREERALHLVAAMLLTTIGEKGQPTTLDGDYSAWQSLTKMEVQEILAQARYEFKQTLEESGRGKAD